MKRFALLGAALVAMGCSSEKVLSEKTDAAAEQPATEVVVAAFNAEGAPTVAFSVPDMMCEDSCVPTVEKTLAEQPGVKDVQVDLESKTATVAVDEGEFDAEKAVAALVDRQFTETKLITAGKTTDAPKSDADAKSEAPAEEQPAAEEEAAKS